MAYEMVMPYHLHMPSYFLETFTEYPWIKGIALTLFPTQDFMNSANLHLKWWEIYSWSKLWKRKVEHWYEYIWLNVPLFRQMVYKLGKNK